MNYLKGMASIQIDVVDVVDSENGTVIPSLPSISNGKMVDTVKPEVILIGAQDHVKDAIKRNSYNVHHTTLIPTSDSDMGAVEVMKLAFRTRSYYVVFFTALFITSGTSFVLNLNKAYGQTFIADDHFLSVVGSISSVFNCLGRSFWGFVMDRFGYRVSLWCICGGLTVACATLILTEEISKGFFLLWMCLVYGLTCGLFAIFPATISRLFGVKHMALLYGFTFWSGLFSSLLSTLAGTSLKSSLGWSGLFYMASGTSALGVIITIFFNGVDESGSRT